MGVCIAYIPTISYFSKFRTVSDQGGYKAAKEDRNINTVQI